MGELECVKELLNSVHKIIDDNNQKDRASGDLFNFFEVCKIQTKEIRHSMFIAELLNPKGSHGQGNLFLCEFVKLLNTRANTSENIEFRNVPFDTDKHIDVWREFKCIDIPIFNSSDVIIIENKINAEARAGQLFEYANRWKEGCLRRTVKAVVYLTPNGRHPGKAALNPAKGKMKIDDIDPEKMLLLISYETDVLEWLERCLQKVNKEQSNLFFMLQQYMTCIRNLTHQGRSKIVSDEIRKIVVDSEEQFEAAQNVASELRQLEAKNVWIGGRDGSDIENDNGQFYKVPIGDGSHELRIFEDMAIGVMDCTIKNTDKLADRPRLSINSREVFNCEVDLVNIATSDKLQNWEWYVEPSDFQIAKLFLAGFPKNKQDVAKKLATVIKQQAGHA